MDFKRVIEGYEVSSHFDNRKDPFTGEIKHHNGIDLVKDEKDYKIKPFFPGKVIFSGETKMNTGLGGFGNVVVIDDMRGYYHLYCHLKKVLVNVDDYVTMDIDIGIEGSTGRSTGPHLHYEIRKKGWKYGFGNHVDPIMYYEGMNWKENIVYDALLDRRLFNWHEPDSPAPVYFVVEMCRRLKG